MNYYKYVRNPGAYRIPVKEKIEDVEPSSYFSDGFLLSLNDEIVKGNMKYVFAIDGMYYENYDLVHNRRNFTQKVVSEGFVSPETKVGLDVFDNYREKRNKIDRLRTNDLIYLNLSFHSDSDDNIWAGITFETENSEWKEGWVIYKNYRNRFPNVIISDSKIDSVLTDDHLDSEKINYFLERGVHFPITLTLRNSLQYFAASSFMATVGAGTPRVTGSSIKTSVISTSTKTKTTKATKVSTAATSTSKKSTKEKKKIKYWSGITLKNVPPAEKTEIKDIKAKSAARLDYYSNSQSKFTTWVAKQAPGVVQNEKGKPAIDKKHYYTTKKGKRAIKKYDYRYTVAGGLPLQSKLIKELYPKYDLDVRSLSQNFKHNVKYYNRFKKPMPDDILSRAFLHVFFTRPDMNILDSTGDKLHSQVKNDPFFRYKWKQRPDLLRELVKSGGRAHDFGMMISNKAQSFSPTDESIKYGEYGKVFQNYSIVLGKSIFESQINGTFEVKYTETRDLDVLAIHKMWIQYISNVYYGKWSPKMTYMYKKILDYAASVYVVVTAEDFETVLWWSKYYGVFPINVPYSALSWDAGQPIIKPDYTITYGYSFKEDWNPAALTEINMNSFKSNSVTQARYIPTYNTNTGRSGTTWVGSPFIEAINKPVEDSGKYGMGFVYKLRFRPGENLY